jgi:predicted phosphodiesterase
MWGEFGLSLEQHGVTADDEVIILGDVGFGCSALDTSNMSSFHKLGMSNVKYIRGNHDDPKCRVYPECLGDYGIYKGIGYVAGGFSKDKVERLERGMTWFENEQLTEEELDEAIEIIKAGAPEVMISHEAPYTIVQRLYNGKAILSRTNNALDVILHNVPSIKQWVFGHYHMPIDILRDGVHFVGLDLCELYTIGEM